MATTQHADSFVGFRRRAWQEVWTALLAEVPALGTPGNEALGFLC